MIATILPGSADFHAVGYNEHKVLFQNELSWAGSNLNQSVKRANELAVAGLLAPSYVYEVLLPSIQDMQDTLNKLKEDLELLHRKSRLMR